jgi:hypothetical protein
VKLSLREPQLAMRNGYMQAATADLPAGTREVKWKVTLAPDDSK